jgi:AbrB family looped-hinge helix DNA binding protein
MSVKGPDGKYIFGMAKVSTKGQIVIPKEAREIFGIKPGDNLLVVGDIEANGLALVASGEFLTFAEQLLKSN